MEFKLNKLEKTRADKWMAERDDQANSNLDLSISRFRGYSYVFTPTSIGTNIKIVDNSNNESLDITDYGAW